VGDLVWYVAYGSNLCRERLQRYLHRGSDPTPPRADRALTIGHPLFFAGESTVWGGGRAYVDHEAVTPAATYARAWLLTRGQWADLHAAESSRAVDAGCDPADVVEGEVRVVGDGRYDVVLGYGTHEAVPVVSFTGPDRLDPAACRAPAVEYLQTIARGLAEAHGLSGADAATYLADRPGVTGNWARADLDRLLRGTHR
jgi:hypothetical protein